MLKRFQGERSHRDTDRNTYQIIFLNINALYSFIEISHFSHPPTWLILTAPSALNQVKRNLTFTSPPVSVLQDKVPCLAYMYLQHLEHNSSLTRMILYYNHLFTVLSSHIEYSFLDSGKCPIYYSVSITSMLSSTVETINSC